MTNSPGPVPVSSVNTAGPAVPILPYAGTSGHSGSAASAERAQREDATGITSRRQALAYAEVRQAAEYGITWKEFAGHYSLHHGQATAPLSILHKEGHIARLANKRARCSVYVLPEYVNGRETSPYRPQVGSKDKVAELNASVIRLGLEVEELVELIRDLMGNSGYCPSHVEMEAGCAECRAQALLSNR